MNLKDAIPICLRCGERLGDIEETRGILLKIAALSQSERERLAKEMRIDLTTLTGLVIISRYACYVLDWFSYHKRPVTRQNVHELEDEMNANHRANNDFLFFDIGLGASFLLRYVKWDSKGIDCTT
jgi:hypothetical protein